MPIFRSAGCVLLHMVFITRYVDLCTVCEFVYKLTHSAQFYTPAHKASFTRRFANAIPVAEWRVRFWSCIKTNGSVHTAIRAGFRMRFSICESPELRSPSYFLDKIRCQLSRRGRGIASITRRILSLHSSTYNLCYLTLKLMKAFPLVKYFHAYSCRSSL